MCLVDTGFRCGDVWSSSCDAFHDKKDQATARWGSHCIEKTSERQDPLERAIQRLSLKNLPDLPISFTRKPAMERVPDDMMSQMPGHGAQFICWRAHHYSCLPGRQSSLYPEARWYPILLYMLALFCDRVNTCRDSLHLQQKKTHTEGRQ